MGRSIRGLLIFRRIFLGSWRWLRFRMRLLNCRIIRNRCLPVPVFTLAVLSAAAFLVVEFRHHSPLIPKPLWRHAAFVTVTTIGFLGNFSYYGLVFFLGLYLERALGFSPLHTGLCFLPLTASTICGNPISGRWTAHVGARGPMLTGQITSSLALLCSSGCCTRIFG